MIAQLEMNIREGAEEIAEFWVFFLVSCVALLLLISLVTATSLRTCPAKILQISDDPALFQVN